MVFKTAIRMELRIPHMEDLKIKNYDESTDIKVRRQKILFDMKKFQVIKY